MTELLPTPDTEIAANIEVPEFNARQIAFFKALLTATQKERLALTLDPKLKEEYLMAFSSLVGKEDQIQWIMDSAEAVKDYITATGKNPTGDISPTFSDEELDVLNSGFDD